MLVLPSTAAWRLHNCCADGGTSLETFGSTIVAITALYQHVIFHDAAEG